MQSVYAVKNSIVKKRSYLKELLKLFRLTIYNFSVSYFVIEVLRFIYEDEDDLQLGELKETVCYSSFIANSEKCF